MIVSVQVLLLLWLGWLLSLPPEELVLRVPDDAYYYCKIVHNFCLGRGFSFDGQTPTTGVHFLHACLLIILRPFSPWDLPQTAIALSFAMFLMSTVPIYVLTKRLGFDEPIRTWVTVLWLLNPNSVSAASMGMEAGLCLLLSPLALLAVIRVLDKKSDEEVQGPVWPWLLAMVLMPLARSDFILLAPVMVALAIWVAAAYRSPKACKRLILVAAGLLTGYLAVVLLCTGITGDPVQDSGAMKLLWRKTVLEQAASEHGLAHVAINLFWTWTGHALAPIVSTINVPRSVSAGGQILAVSLLVLALAFSSSDRRWGLATVLALLHIVSWSIACSLLDAVYHGWALGGVMYAGYVIALAVVRWAGERNSALRIAVLLIWSGSLLIGDFKLRLDPPWKGQEKQYQAARAMSLVFHHEDRIGSFNSGILSWYSGKDVVNLDGLVNPRVRQAVLADEFPQLLHELRLNYVVDTQNAMLNFSTRCLYWKPDETNELFRFVDVSQGLEQRFPLMIWRVGRRP